MDTKAIDDATASALAKVFVPITPEQLGFDVLHAILQGSEAAMQAGAAAALGAEPKIPAFRTMGIRDVAADIIRRVHGFVQPIICGAYQKIDEEGERRALVDEWTPKVVDWITSALPALKIGEWLLKRIVRWTIAVSLAQAVKGLDGYCGKDAAALMEVALAL